MSSKDDKPIDMVTDMYYKIKRQEEILSQIRGYTETLIELNDREEYVRVAENVLRFMGES